MLQNSARLAVNDEGLHMHCIIALGCQLVCYKLKVKYAIAVVLVCTTHADKGVNFQHVSALYRASFWSSLYQKDM